jgi:Asp-tRNA(Asn)/Glu-tRNA(Gln) amidotransferase A subunit family amidase
LVVKDVTAVKGMRLTMGSKLLADRVAEDDAPLVAVSGAARRAR